MKCIAFDCFGTVFDMSTVPRNEISDYVKHVRADKFTPYKFPESWYNLKAHSDAAEGLDMLHKMGLVCATLSNGDVNLLKAISEKNGLHWDYYVDLVTHKVYKPHKDAYLTIEKDLGIPTHETIMVTANPTFGDVEGSLSVGMKCCVIRQEGYPATIIDLATKLATEN